MSAPTSKPVGPENLVDVDQVERTPPAELAGDGSSLDETTRLAPGGITSGRGRVSKLPAAHSLRVPSREDAGVSVRGPSQGSPADALVAATPASSPMITPGVTAGFPGDAVAGGTEAGVPTRRTRRRIVTGVLVFSMLPAGIGGVAWWDQRSERVARDQRAVEVVEAVALEGARIAEQTRAASDARSAALRAEVTERGWALATTAAEVLGASQGRVGEEVVRENLGAAIGALTDALESGDLTDMANLSDDVNAAVTAVQDAQGAWEVAESARVEAEAQAAADAAAAQPPASAPTGQGTRAPSAPSSTPQSPTSPPAAAPQAPTGGDQGPANSGVQAPQTKVINPGRSSTDGTPGMTTVTATTSGITGAVYATVAGVTLQMGTGSGSFSVTFTELPAGEHQWSINADGLTAHGTSLITVF